MKNWINSVNIFVKEHAGVFTVLGTVLGILLTIALFKLGRKGSKKDIERLERLLKTSFSIQAHGDGERKTPLTKEQEDDISHDVTILEKELKKINTHAQRIQQETQQKSARILGALGTAYYELRSLDKSAENFERALGIYRELAETDPHIYDADVVVSLINKGILSLQKGERQRRNIWQRQHSS